MMGFIAAPFWLLGKIFTMTAAFIENVPVVVLLNASVEYDHNGDPKIVMYEEINEED